VRTSAYFWSRVTLFLGTFAPIYYSLDCCCCETRGALVVHQGERERVLVARIKGGTTTASPRGLSARALAVSRPSRSERACTRCLKTVSATDNVAEVRHGALLVERSLGAA
jgi:hypothetical protein